METGLFTNRSPLHDTASWLYSKYGGYPDALFDGQNMEVSNELTLIRRPGLIEWSAISVPGSINWFYDWNTLDQGPLVVVDSTLASYIQTPNTQEQIFTKEGGATYGYYQGVADVLYYGDGVQLLKYVIQAPPATPAQGTTFNWGITPAATWYTPTQNLTNPAQTYTIVNSQGTTLGVPPVIITETGSAAQQWVDGTEFSTMGIIRVNDTTTSTEYLFQLVSVNAEPVLNPNTTQIGLTGNGQPFWDSVPPGGTVADSGGWNWTNWGPIVEWSANTVYNNATIGGTNTNPCIIYDPGTGCCFIIGNASNNPGTSGNTPPHWPSAPGSQVNDTNTGSDNAKWFNLGALKTPQQYQQGHLYPKLGGGANDSQAGIVEPTGFASGFPTGYAVKAAGATLPFLYWWVNDTGSNQTSGTTPTQPAWSFNPNTTTTDNQCQWLCLGVASRTPGQTCVQWTANGSPFTAFVDPNGNVQVCTIGGTASGTVSASITWGTTYGSVTNESLYTAGSTVVWTCIGPYLSWAANTPWYMPPTGWFPPSGAVPYGGSIITDSNGNLQATIISGISNGTNTPPTWATTPVGAQTTEAGSGTITWALIGPAGVAGASWTKGRIYAFSYESRLGNDQYNYLPGTIIPAYPSAVWNAPPPDWPSALGAPTGAGTGHISTASQIYTITGANPGAAVTLNIPGSTDPQVDTIVIWRSLDGGSTLFFLTEVPNKLPYQTVVDIQPDTTINQFIEAPIADANDPPPAGFLPMAYHFGRIWGAVGNFVYASGGPDVVVGVGNESFDPEDFFEFPSPVTKIVPTATGIYVFLTNAIYAILGGPVFSTFFPTPAVPGVGLLHYNALDVHGANIFLFSADRQFLSLDPSGGVNRMGGPLADKLQTFDPTKAFVTVHESGNDNAVYVADGVNGWFRLNPYQFPNGTQVWSPFAEIVNGAGVVLSIETSRGIHQLLVSNPGNIPSGNQVILYRDETGTVYTDNLLPYTCYFTMGSINVANPGQIAGLTFLNLRATRVGTAPAPSFLLNEVSGAFTAFPESQAYPWQIFGATKQPTSLYANAYYFRDAGVPALAEHLQIKVSFPAENFANEVLSLTLYGVIEQPPEE
jgi:hypothetical protein